MAIDLMNEEIALMEERPVPAESVVPAADVDIAALIARTMRGQWSYEQNVFATLTGRPPTPEESELVRILLLGLSSCPGARDDSTLTRLCASTGANFLDAVRPAIAGYDYLRHLIVTPPSTGVTAATVAMYRQRCEDCLGQLVADGETSVEGGKGIADVLDRLAAEMLAHLDIELALLPAFKIVARLPALANAYLEERRAWPNRYAGIKPSARPTADHVHAASRALDLLRSPASFIDLLTGAVLGCHVAGAERSLVHAALVAGTPPVGAAASSMAVTLLAMRGAGFVEAFQGLLSTFGYYHLGALPECARMLWRMRERGGPLDVLIDEELASSVWHLGGDHKGVRRVPGFGHRFYKADPRGRELLKMCRLTVSGPYIDLIAQLNDILQQRHVGHVNMDGIGAAMALHFGFSPLIASCLTLVSRVFGVAALYRSIEPDPGDICLLVRSAKMGEYR